MHTPRRPNKPRRVIYSIDELPAYCDCADVGLYLRVNPDVLEYERKLFGLGGEGDTH